MDMHPWWTSFGELSPNDAAVGPMATTICSALRSGLPGIALVEVRHDTLTGRVGISITVEVERPQVLELPIRAVEPIAILLRTAGDAPPAVLSLRADFPDSNHQTWVPEGFPLALCTDDRPWSEAALSWTPVDMIRRIQLWLAKAARGELHETARPLEPLFFPAPQALIIPRSAFAADGQTAELVGFVHSEDKRVIVAHDLMQLPEALRDRGRLLIAVVHAGDRQVTRMRHAPTTLQNLIDEVRSCGVDLIKELRTKLQGWAGLEKSDVRRLTSLLVIIVAFRLKGADGQIAQDIKAFITSDTAGEVGVALGALLANKSDKGAKDAYLRALVAGPATVDKVHIEPPDYPDISARGLTSAIVRRG